MLKQKRYVRGYYRSVKSDYPIWHWQDHTKLVAIGFLLYILEWQGNIAFHNARELFLKYQVVQHLNSQPLVSPLPSKMVRIDNFIYIKPTPTPIPAHVRWNEFKEKIREIAPIYDFPINVALSQAALESSRGTSQYALERNNYFGYGAIDSDPDQATFFDNPEQGIIAYMQLVKYRFPQAYALRHSPDQMIVKLEQNDLGLKYASDPSYVSKLVNLPEWNEK